MAGVRMSVLNDVRLERMKKILPRIQTEERKRIKQIMKSKEMKTLKQKEKEEQKAKAEVTKLEKKLGVEGVSYKYPTRMKYDGKGISCEGEYAEKIVEKIDDEFLTLKISIATVSNEEVGALIKEFLNKP